MNVNSLRVLCDKEKFYRKRREGRKESLERKFHGDLNLPRRKRAADVSESGTRNIGIRRLKIRAIEQIKKLGAELDARFFVNRQTELFMHAQIELEKIVAAGDVATGVAERLV